MSIDISEEHIVSIFRVEEISRARNHQKQVELCYFFDPEDGGDMVLRNVG
jgi:hypothetical protein